MTMNVNANGSIRKSREAKCFMYSKKELNELKKIREATIKVIEDILCDYDPLFGFRRLEPPKAKSAEEIVLEAMSSHKPKVPSKVPSTVLKAPKPKAPMVSSFLHNTNVQKEIIGISIKSPELEDEDLNTSDSDANRILEHAREYDSVRAEYVAELERRRSIVDNFMQFINELHRYIKDGIYSEAIKLSRNNLSGNFREEVIHALITSARAEAPINLKAASDYKEYKKYSEAYKQIRDGLRTILGR